MVTFSCIFGIGLLAGSANSIIEKLMFQSTGIGIDGTNHYFQKPWFMSLVMFLAMLLALPLHYCLRRRSGKTSSSASANASPPGAAAASSIGLRMWFTVCIPSVFDLLGSSLQAIGLVYTPVSVYQMLKGSILLFSALFSVIFLGRKMYRHHWVGVCLCLIALVLVGVSSLSSREQQTQVVSLPLMLLGIFIIVAGQVVCAAQYVLEEFLLKPPNDVAPMALVGLEGFWGTLLMCLVFVPALQNLPGSDTGKVMENTEDSFVMLSNSPLLLTCTLGFIISILVFNICGVMVTAEASAMHHTFLDASRTIVIWLVSVLMYYAAPGNGLGEPLTKYSWVQALGFVLLVYGQLVYDQAVRLPFGLDTKARVSPSLVPLSAPLVASPAERKGVQMAAQLIVRVAPMLLAAAADTPPASRGGGGRLLLYVDSGNPRLRAPLCTREELEAEIREQVLRECESGSTWLRLSVLSKQERRHRLSELVRERTAKLTANGGMGTLHCDDDLALEIRAKYGTILSTSFREFLTTLPLHLPESMLVSASLEVRLNSPPEGLLKYPKLGLVNIQMLIDSVEASLHSTESARCPFDLDSIFPQPGDLGLLLFLHVESLPSFPEDALISFANRCVARAIPVHVAVFGVQPTADDMGMPELLLTGLCLETGGWYAQCPLLGTPTFINNDSAISPIIRKEFAKLSRGGNGSTTATGSGEANTSGGGGSIGSSYEEEDLIDLAATQDVAELVDTSGPEGDALNDMDRVVWQGAAAADDDDDDDAHSDDKASEDAGRTEQPILPCPGDEYSEFAEGMEHPAIVEAEVDGEYSSVPQEEDLRGAGGACAVASETTGSSSSSSPVVNVGGSSQAGELSRSPQPSPQSTSHSPSTSSRSSLASSSTPPYQGRRGSAVPQESSSVEQPSTAVNGIAAAAAGTDHSYDHSEEDLAYHRPIAAEISGSSQRSPSTSYGSRPEGASGMAAMPVEYLVNTPPPLWGDVADDLEDDFSSGIEAAALASAEYLAGFGSKIFSLAQQAVSTPRDAYPPGQVVVQDSLSAGSPQQRPPPAECRMEMPGVFSRSRDSIGGSSSLSSASSDHRSPRRLIVIDGREKDKGLVRRGTSTPSPRAEELPSVPIPTVPEHSDNSVVSPGFGASSSSAILASASDDSAQDASWLSTVWRWLRDPQDDSGSTPAPDTPDSVDTRRKLLGSVHVAVAVAERVSTLGGSLSADDDDEEYYAKALAELTRAIGDLEDFGSEEVEELLILLESALMIGHHIAALIRQRRAPSSAPAVNPIASPRRSTLGTQQARLRGVVGRCREEAQHFTRSVKYATTYTHRPLSPA
ncbi:hypothetical protein FOZ62_004224 [Perkinsus olseni]|uniref:EamA domain-containing protein n=1 Tax=Perkinsus olseni TaxID=32597 RepID=A0A7J6NXI4_PEROL|nr:hypothetical protein FOZ62_004224 [Perkinsus olseni]